MKRICVWIVRIVGVACLWILNVSKLMNVRLNMVIVFSKLSAQLT